MGYGEATMALDIYDIVPPQRALRLVPKDAAQANRWHRLRVPHRHRMPSGYVVRLCNCEHCLDHVRTANQSASGLASSR